MALSHDAFRTHFAPAFIAGPGARIVRQGADPIVRPRSAWAWTYPRLDPIVVSDRLYAEHPSAHRRRPGVDETWHAVASDDVGPGEPCYQDELLAHALGSQAYVKTRVPMAYSPRDLFYALVTGDGAISPAAGEQLLGQWDAPRGGHPLSPACTRTTAPSVGWRAP